MPNLSKNCPVSTKIAKYLVDPDIEVEIFFKNKRAKGKGGIGLENGH